MSGPARRSLVITCEHGGFRVPPPYRHMFRAARRVLSTHRGYDLGALELARALSRQFHAPLVASTTTRLLVDLNRSPGRRGVFSEYSAALDDAGRRKVLNRYYWPYRRRVEMLIARAIERGNTVFHLSVHSFTPVWNGQIRRADLGLLYDPARPLERELCSLWQRAICRCRNDLRVRRNYPYLGRSDGLTTHLRRRFSADRYTGVELEINQRWPELGGSTWRELRRNLIAALDTFL